jgi:hypothetical protein
VEAAPHRSQCKALVSSRSAVATAPRTGDKSERPVKKERKEAKGTTGKKKKKKRKKDEEEESCTRQTPTNRSGKGKQNHKENPSISHIWAADIPGPSNPASSQQEKRYPEGRKEVRHIRGDSLHLMSAFRDTQLDPLYLAGLLG